MLTLLDVGVDFLTVHPSVKRDDDAAYQGIVMAFGTGCKVKYCRMDGAKELISACK